MMSREKDQPEGALGGDPSCSQRNEMGLKTLEDRLQEFVSVSVMNKSLTALRKELDEIKAQKSNSTDRERSKEKATSPREDGEPQSKRPRNDYEDSESTDHEEDPVDRFMRQEEEESEEEDIVSSLGQYFNDDEEIGPKIDDDLAKMANEALRGKARPEKLKKLAEKYKRPANVENLQVPKVEELLWRQLRKESKGPDYLLQKTQSSFSLALIPIIKAVGILHNTKNKELRELQELVTDSFKILTLEVTNNHDVRRERIKKELEPKYRGICNKETSTTKLFGDQLQEAIKALGDSKFSLTLHQSSKKAFLGQRGEPSHSPVTATVTTTTTIRNDQVPDTGTRIRDSRNQEAKTKNRPSK